MTVQKAAALLLAVPVLAAVPASAAISPDAEVARVGEAPISYGLFHHWMYVAAVSSGRLAEDPIIPRAGTREYRGLTQQVMQFLVSAKWIRLEADRQGIHVRRAMAVRQFHFTRRLAFRRPGSWSRFLRRSGMTVGDVVYRVELDMLSNRLRRKITRPYENPRRQQRALDEFVAGFRARWLPLTACAPGYRTTDCSGALPRP
jgi:hypothetical protein